MARQGCGRSPAATRGMIPADRGPTHYDAPIMPSATGSDRPPWSDPAVAAATCGWVGRIPLAPGTFGSLVGLPLALATGAAASRFAAWLGDGPSLVVAAEVAFVVALVAACVPLCTAAARRLGDHDPGPVVIDEAIALPLALVPVPPADRGLTALVAAFALFRLFDILKPPPVRQAERLPAGLGIVADDQAAALLTAACLALARWQAWL